MVSSYCQAKPNFCNITTWTRPVSLSSSLRLVFITSNNACSFAPTISGCTTILWNPYEGSEGSQSRQRTVFKLKAPKLFEGPYIIRRTPKMSILNATWPIPWPVHRTKSTCGSLARGSLSLLVDLVLHKFYTYRAISYFWSSEVLQGTKDPPKKIDCTNVAPGSIRFTNKFPLSVFRYNDNSLEIYLS